MNCPNCNSSHIKKNGFSISLVEPKQRYKCMECSKRFTVSEVAEDEDVAILVLDIETLPIIAYTWGTWGVDITTDKIIKDWSILSLSGKWIGDDHIISECLTPKEAVARDDKRICQIMWKLMDQAGLLIAQNGRRFDIPKLNTRFWHHRMFPPSSYKIIDTLDAAKRAFGMTYNSLDYLGEYLGAGRKLKTEFNLWAQCDRGEQEALDRMREYNENDVVLLEDIYMKMRPWIPNHPRLTAYNKAQGVCPVCLGEYERIGLYTAAQRQYNEYRCLSCHSVFHDTKHIK